MMLRVRASRLGLLVASAPMGLVYLLALLLRPWRLGRLLRTVSLPRMQEHPLRTAFTVLGISLGVAVLVSVVLVSRSIVSGVTATVDDLAGKADLQVAGGSSGFDEAVLDKVRELPGVYKLTPVVQQIATLHTRQGRRERMLVMGVDLLGTDDAYFRSYASKELDAIRADPLTFLNGPTNIVLSRELADRVGARLHDKISVGTGAGLREFEIFGFVEGSGLARAFGGALGVMYYPAMQVTFERGRNIDHIDIAVQPGRDPETVARALQAALGEAFTIQRPALRGDRVSQMLTAMRSALTMSSLIALIAGAFLVLNTMSISVVQRKRELGILRALGTRPRELTTLLTLEGALLGGAGSVLGLLLAIGLSRSLLRMFGDAVSQFYVEQATNEVQIDASMLIAGLVLGVASASCAAFLATRRAGQVTPSEAISSSGGSDLVSEQSSLRADLLGAALLLVSLLLVQIPASGNMPFGPFAACLTLTVGGRALMPRLVRMTSRALAALSRGRLGVEALLANGNLPRDLARSAGTASGLMAGAALTVTVGTFVSSFIFSLNTWGVQSVPGDLFVTSGAAFAGLSRRNTPVAEALGAELAAIDGVELIRPIRNIDIEYHNISVKLESTDNELFARHGQLTLLEGSESDAFEQLKRGAVVVSENFSRRFDVHRGDAIALPTKNGTRRFTVAAVAIDYTSDLGAIRMDRAIYVEHWNDPSVDTYELYVKQGTSPESVRRRINQGLGERYDLFVLTNSEFRAEFVKAVDKIFALMHVLEIITLLVAALGMVTAVLANVLDRVREIGVLRALGMLRPQVQKMVMVEAMLIGGIGAMGGTLVGLGIGYILLRRIVTVQMGWYLPYELPITAIATVAAVTLPLSGLAGFYPARQAARLVVRDALDYE
jgi:putative ABC transport system permease protein